MTKRTVLIILSILLAVKLCGCGGAKTYTCSWCGTKTREAYHTALRPGEYFCADCAEQYFGQFQYKSYQVK